MDLDLDPDPQHRMAKVPPQGALLRFKPGTCLGAGMCYINLALPVTPQTSYHTLQIFYFFS